MKKIVPVTTTSTQKEISNTFDSCIIKLFFFFFKAIVFISLQKKLQKCVEYKKGYTRFICSVGRDRERKGEISLIYSGDIRETTTDFCYRHIDLVVCFLGFVDKIIWIHKDSLSISWF